MAVTPVGPLPGLAVSKLTSPGCLRVFCSGKMKAKADQIGFQPPAPALVSEPLLSAGYIGIAGKMPFL